jgi:hypothetical protein
MQMIQAHGNPLPAWRPARYAPRNTLSQNGNERPTPFIDSALVSFMTDVAAAIPTGILAVTFTKAGWTKTGIALWLVTGFATVKGIYDLSRVQTRR